MSPAVARGPERVVEQLGGWTIVLCAGPINYTHLPIGTNVSNAMIPINGRPVIGWILDDLLRKGIDRVAVVVRADDARCQAFVRRAYGGRMELRVTTLDGGTILHSLQAGLRAAGVQDGSVRVVLGDTLIRDQYDADVDFVYVASVEDSSRWCLAVTDAQGVVTDYIDKEELVPGPKSALAGYYHFADGSTLLGLVDESVDAGERELSAVLRRYGAVHPMTAREATNWYDFGHIDGLVEARRQLIHSRAFNSLEVNPILNTVTKVSRDDKLRDEWNWYQRIPDELKVLAPRIVEFRELDGQIRMVQEYYGYPSLADLYVFGDIAPETWMSILRQVLRIHEEFRRYTGDLEPEELLTMYVDKTWKRLAELREQSPAWVWMLERDEIVVNGRPLAGLSAIEDRIRERAESLALGAEVCIVHGDFCFSNILYDVPNQILRLVDPRGSFGRRGIYGDSRYDVAKLRHSVGGLYDFVVFDMYRLVERDGAFTADVFAPETTRIVADYLDRMVVAAGYDLDEIAFVEGLLFLSMLPLHAGAEDRQKMMYLTALSRFDQTLASVP
ncbi:MAG: NTP transferase domain-containing protein [Actinomycetota bacterium]|nr:NTP transferase domain-containing protein [Actinomycetota bacterium]